MAAACLPFRLETAVSQADALLSQLEKSHALYPHAIARLELEERLVIQQAILQSSHFYEQMADLRTTTHRVQDDLTIHYIETRQRYQAAVQKTRTHLENLPAWAHLSDEEGQEMASALPWTSLEQLAFS